MHRANLLLVLATTAAFSWQTTAPLHAQPADPLEDPPQALEPRVPRSEREADRLHAAALFATARTLEQQGRKGAALRKYQRAWRYDREAVTALREIVPLAFSLDRSDEAVRYALLAAERDPVDGELLRRLAAWLTERGEWQRALRLYKQSAATAAEEDDPLERLLTRLEMGRLYFLSDQAANAAEHFAAVEAALERPDESGLDARGRRAVLGNAQLTWQMFGEVYLEAELLDKAEQAYRNSHRAKPDRGLLGLQLARIEAERKRPASGLDELQHYFEADLDTAEEEPYELLGRLLTALNQPDELDERLAALREQHPENRALALYLADRLRLQGDLRKAETIYRQLTAGEEDVPGEVYRGLLQVYASEGRVAELLDALGAALDRLGGLDELPAEVALIAEKQGLLGRLLSEARRRNPLPASAARAVGLVAIEAGQIDAGGEFFEATLEQLLASGEQDEQAAELLVEWGAQLYAAQRYEAAAAVFRRSTQDERLGKENAALYFYLAGALELAGKTDAALETARAGAELRPRSALFASREPWILYHADRADEAVAAYEVLLKKFDRRHTSEDLRDVIREARLVLSSLEVTRGNLPQAEEWLEQVLDEFPEEIGAMNDLGYLWADQNKRLGRARQMIERAVAAEPDNHAYLDSLGWVYFRLGRFADAVQVLEQAADDKEVDGVILDHLGDAYHGAGRQQDAAGAWKRAVEAFRRDEQPEKAKRVEQKLAGESP